MLSIVLAAILAVLGFISPGPRLMALPTIGVTIDGGTVTSQLLSASWNLGIDNFLADLAPNTASLSFKGQLSVSPADAVVITAGGTAMWTGRLDSYTETRDVNGDYWSSVTATDVIGALGAVELHGWTIAGTERLDSITESLASYAGLFIDVEDSRSQGELPGVQSGITEVTASTASSQDYDGPLLGLVSIVAKGSNAMMAMDRNGTIKCWVREKMAEGFVTNGTFDTNTSGWAATGTGASITRVTASPYAGAGNARIVSGTSLYGGADFAITGWFRRDHTYRLDFRGRTISGSADIISGIGDQGALDLNNPTKTLTGSWAQYLVDWTPSAATDQVSIIFRNTAAVSNTFEIDSVLVYEVVNAVDVSSAVVTWEKTTTIDVDINNWVTVNTGGGGYTISSYGSDAADIAIYGERTFDNSEVQMDTMAQLDDWVAYGGSQRPVVTRGELVVSDSSSSLLALDPLDWVNDGTDSWQVMSMSWSAVPGEPWRLTITADNLIYLLRGY